MEREQLGMRLGLHRGLELGWAWGELDLDYPLSMGDPQRGAGPEG